MHPIHRITTYPYRSHVLRSPGTEKTRTNGEIVVEDDVWICYGATILSGVRIGRGSVISACSIITKDVPPYSVVINGEVKKYRFSEELRNRLVKVDLDKLKMLIDEEQIEKILDQDITEENIEDILIELEEK